ncbi:hypothetical protein D3C77_192980 [compost metagenome]
MKSASATVNGATGYFAVDGNSIEPTGFRVISSSFTAHSNIVCRPWVAERFTVDDFHPVSLTIFLIMAELIWSISNNARCDIQ